MMHVRKGLQPPILLMPMLASKDANHLAFSQEALDAGLKALVLMNCAWLKYYPATPDIYKSGCVYKPEFKQEAWETIPYILKLGYGDCEDLSSWRAAELRVRHGIPAWSIAKLRKLPDGTIRGHAVVQLPNGQIEDPSAKLGMYLYSY